MHERDSSSGGFPPWKCVSSTHVHALRMTLGSVRQAASLIAVCPLPSRNRPEERRL